MRASSHLTCNIMCGNITSVRYILRYHRRLLFLFLTLILTISYIDFNLPKSGDSIYPYRHISAMASRIYYGLGSPTVEQQMQLRSQPLFEQPVRRKRPFVFHPKAALLSLLLENGANVNAVDEVRQ